jgi:cytochrome P450/nitrite reductase/ring-hydroxylating ferredoxin subunit
MTRPPHWVRMARGADLIGPGPFAVSGGGRDVVVLRGAQGLKAFDGRCPHQGALLGEGELEDGALVCRNHRWRFATETGRRIGGAQCLVPCPVREEDGQIEVDTALLDANDKARVAARRLSDLPGPPSLPLVGSAHLLDAKSLHLQIEEWARTYGTPFSYRFGPKPVVVFSELDAIGTVLRERPGGFRRTSSVVPIFQELGVAGVFSAEGEAWRPQRRLSVEALAQRHLRGFYPTLANVASRLRGRWLRAAERHEPLDLSEELKRFTVDITTELVFGYDINTLEKDDNVIQRKLELIFPTFARRLNSVIPWWRIFRMPKDRAVDRAVSELREWLGGLVRETRARLDADPARRERPANFLESMVTAKDDAGKPFDDETVFGNAMTMLLAGEDTTAYTLAWTVHHLLDTPSETRALEAEVDAILGTTFVPKDFDTANRLAFAAAAANESMRLRPVAPLFFLEACEDTVVAGVEVKKGNWALLLIRPPATQKESFSDPLTFRPSRWVESNESTHEPGAHLPFGSGPRICPGRALAMLEMKVVLATLYRNFNVERIGSSEDVHEIFSFTMKPSDLRIRLSRRPEVS